MHPLSTAAHRARAPIQREIQADRGHLAHSFLKMVLEQHKWLIDLPDIFAMQSELRILLPLLTGRLNQTMAAEPTIAEWTIRGIAEVLLWLKVRNAKHIKAEPILPRILLSENIYLTAKAPDIEFVMGNNGQLTVAEMKNGRAALHVSYGKLMQYGVAELLKHHHNRKLLRSVELRWLGLVYPGENGIPFDCEKILRIERDKLTLKRADRWLKKNYKVTFRQALANMQAHTKG